MDAIAELHAHETLYLAALEEPKVNALRIVVHAARRQGGEVPVADPPVPGAFPIKPDDSTPTFEILFSSYVSYLVRNESFACNSSSDIWTGHLYRRYESSEYLRFVRASTIASEDYPGPLTHSAIVCLDHIIDVVSVAEPVVRVLGRGLGI
jgi:hypothetical protein